LGPNLGVFPLEQTRHVGVAKSEHPTLTKVKLFSKNSNLCDHNSPTLQTDGQTDDMHRAVKINNRQLYLAHVARKKLKQRQCPFDTVQVKIREGRYTFTYRY